MPRVALTLRVVKTVLECFLIEEFANYNSLGEAGSVELEDLSGSVCIKPHPGRAIA